MPNMTTLESLNLYAAAIDFLASRYNRRTRSTAASTTGSPTTEVDAGWVWTNAGIKNAAAVHGYLRQVDAFALLYGSQI